MVAQLLYDNVVIDVKRALSEEGLLVRNCSEVLYTYRDGAWGIMSPAETTAVEDMMYKAAADHTFPFAEKGAGLWKTLRRRSPNLAYEVLDKTVLIACPNGTLDPMTGKLMEHDPAHYTTRRIAIEYRPKAKCPEWLAMIERCLPDKTPETRAQYIAFLQEFFGMSLIGFNQYTPRDLRKALFLYGASGTAKTSGVADVLRQFYCEGEVSEENVDQLSTQFGLARLVSSRALISDDAVSPRSKPDPNVLKKLITGEPMTANKKYKDAQSFRFRGPIVFTTNTKPRIDDESDALFNRSVLLTFDYRFNDEDKKLLKGMTPVMFLKSKDEFPGILNWALDGMRRARERGQYTQIEEAKDAGEAWRAENDPAFDFLTRYGRADKGTHCSIELLSRMISVYSDDEYDRKTAVRTAKNRIRREAGDIVKGIKLTRDNSGSDVISGLRIAPEGVMYEKLARDRGLVPLGVKWVINGKTL